MNEVQTDWRLAEKYAYEAKAEALEETLVKVAGIQPLVETLFENSGRPSELRVFMSTLRDAIRTCREKAHALEPDDA